MVDLRNVAAVVGSPLKVVRTGRLVRGSFRPARTPTPGFADTFSPRKSFVVNSRDPLAAGEELLDPAIGIRFLPMLWSEDGMGQAMHSRVFILFEVTGHETWARMQTVVEPISGQHRTTTPTPLGTIAVVRERLKVVNEPQRSADQVYRVLTKAALLVDDLLNGRKVIRVEPYMGITYAEVR